MHEWLLKPFAVLSEDQKAQWLRHWYLPTHHDTLLQDCSRSVVLLAPQGSGITTSLEILAHEHPIDRVPNQTDRIFWFDYQPEHWHGSPQALYHQETSTHFEQWLAQILEQLVILFQSQPHLLQKLAIPELEFLIWLSRYVWNRRRADTLVRTMQRHLSDGPTSNFLHAIQDNDLTTLYDPTLATDIAGIIDELMQLIRFLGWASIMAIVDLTSHAFHTMEMKLKPQLNELLAQLVVLRNPHFGFKICVPHHWYSVTELKEIITRNRAEIYPVTWSNDQLQTLIQGYAQTLKEHTPEVTLESWLQQVQRDMYTIWGQPTPAAIGGITHWMLDDKQQPHTLVSLRRYLYENYAKLRYYPEINPQIIWRGQSQITLDEAQISIFRALWRQAGRKQASNQELERLAGSKANLDKIISRIRAKIEPLDQRNYVYLQRSQAEGIYLEACLR